LDSTPAWPEPLPFRRAADWLGALGAATARVIAAAADVTLVLDAEGVIFDLAAASPELAALGIADWIGRRWTDTVAPDSRVKVAEMLEDRVRPRRWRQVNQLIAGGEIPLRFIAMEAGPDGRMLAVGRDLRAAAELQQRLIQAQQAMERDHLALRQAETRYRALFDLSGEPMMIVDAETRRVIEANRAALALTARDGWTGEPLSALAQDRDREAVMVGVGAALVSDKAQPVLVRLAADGRRIRLSLSLFRQGRASYLLARLLPEGGAPAAGDASWAERVPDPFVLTDDSMTVITANAAFLELVGAARPEDVEGRPLAQYLGRPGIDGPLMAAQLREHGFLRKFGTLAFGRFGAQDEVEVSAAATPEGDAVRYSFTLRPAPLRREVPVTNLDHPSSIEQLTQLVGRMSLKDIVRESTDLIERLCIEAALRYTSDNRANAAEILGLSRQGLYSKLNRFGMARAGAGDEES